jgi:hypothetical protein
MFSMTEEEIMFVRIGERLERTKIGFSEAYPIDSAPIPYSVNGLPEGLHALISRTSENAWVFSVSGAPVAEVFQRIPTIPNPPSPGDKFLSRDDALCALRQYLRAYLPCGHVSSNPIYEGGEETGRRCTACGYEWDCEGQSYFP